MVEKKIKLGVSACLLGQEVRYDGGHKHNAWLTGPLAEFVELIPTCPEMAIGLGVPRPPIRLVGDSRRPRALGVADAALDVTDRLEAFSAARAAQLEGLSGHVLTQNSPSCGLEGVKVYDEHSGACGRSGSGLFARALAQHNPSLPLEEDERLIDPVLRENFITRVFVYRRWQGLIRDGLTPGGLIDFHTRHEYLVMAHSPGTYRRLGRMLSDLSPTAPGTIATTYLAELMSALRCRIGRQSHVDILQRILGHLKKRIDGDGKAEILDGIEAYRRGEVHLVAPITLLRHQLRVHPDPFLERQVYLRPHPDKLELLDAI